MVYLFVSACNLQDLVILASGWSNTKLVKRLQAIRWNNDVKCASVSWIAPLHGRMGNYWTRKSAVKSQEGKFAKRKWYSASSLYRISCGHNLKFKRISTLWHGTPSTYLPTSLPSSRHTHTHTHLYTRIRTQSRAQSYQYTRMEMFYLLSCFCSWLALKFSALAAWDASCLAAWLLHACLPGSSDAPDSWHVAGATTAATCTMQDAGHGEGEASFARPRDVYAIWVISAPRGSRNRPVAVPGNAAAWNNVNINN